MTVHPKPYMSPVDASTLSAPPAGCSAPSRPRGDEAVADVGQVEAARAVAATALDELLYLVLTRHDGSDIIRDWVLREIIGRLIVLAPEQTYAAIQATREGLS